MRPVAQGRPGTQVIPTDWAANQQPVVEGTMADAAVELRDPTATTTAWNPTTEQNEAVPAAAYWSGGARIQALNQQGNPVVVAEDPESVADYLVVISASVWSVREGHVVKVAGSDDPALTGRTLRVQTVVRGSHRFERDLFCTLSD